MPFGSRRSFLRIRARSLGAVELVSALVVLSQPTFIFIFSEQVYDARMISSVHVLGDYRLAHRALLIQKPRRFLSRCNIALGSIVAENVSVRQAVFFGAQADDLTY